MHTGGRCMMLLLLLYGSLTIWLNVRIVLSSQTVYCFDYLWGTDRKLTKRLKAFLFFFPASDRASEAGRVQQVLWQRMSCIHGTQIGRWLWADGSPASSGQVWFLAYFIYSFSDALPFFRYTWVSNLYNFPSVVSWIVSPQRCM